MEEKKSNRFYSRQAKIIVRVLLFAFLLMSSACGMIALGLLGSTGSVEELTTGVPFERTQQFASEVYGQMHSVSQCIAASTYFETDGEFDPDKTIDIMNMKEQDPKKQNKNTTYTVDAIEELSQSNSIMSLQQEMDTANYASYEGEYSDEGTETTLLSDYSPQFVYLYTHARAYETRDPISGVKLADYAKENKDTVSLVELYKALCHAGTEYANYEQLSGTSRDTGNIKYFIKDNSTGQSYSNESWENIDQAWQAMREWGVSIRYTKTPEKISFEQGGFEGTADNLQKKLQSGSLLSSKEEVVIGVDTNYPELDRLKDWHDYYEHFGVAFLPLMVVALVGLLGFIICFIMVTIQTGRNEVNNDIMLNGFDHVPTEISAAIVCIVVGIALGMTIGVSGELGMLSSGSGFAIAVVAGVGVIVIAVIAGLWGYLSLVRRMKAKTLWSNSLCRSIVIMCKRVYKARTMSKRTMISFVLFVFIHIILLMGLGGFGLFMVLVGDLVVLLYLLKEAAGRQIVRQGVLRIASGDLDYKIDVSTLQQDNLEMAEAVNQVNEGLQKAVEKSMKDERMRTDLITNVSHDIKTPLTSIINYVDLLKRENIDDEKVNGYINILDAKSQRLKQLIENLVEASKVSSGSIELQLGRVLMQEILQQAYAEFDTKFQNKKLEIILTMVEEPLVIWADGRQLWRIFENLLNNIAKYALTGTRVYIDLRIINQKAVLMFKNISEDPLNISADELTERFVRGDVSRTTEGSGLGLSIAKSLTELQNGNFEIYLDGDLFKVTISFEIMKS